MIDDDAQATLDRLEAKIEGLEERLAQQAPMTPGRAAAEARQAMARGYEAAAAEREQARAAKDEGGEE
jgi:hypothetical protein